MKYDIAMHDALPWVELGLVACLVGIAAYFLRISYTIFLVIVGFVLSIIKPFDISLSKEMILFLFLPPLLFEGSLHMKLAYLRRYAWPVAILALVGTLVSAGLIAVGARLVLHFDWEMALLLGVILSPTDPVAVLAMFKKYGAPKGLQMILEGESVFNDGIGIVLYAILLEGIGGETITLSGGVIEFLQTVLGGALIGFGIGWGSKWLVSKIDDHLTEILISVVCAYGSFIVAETFHLSGVISTVLAGLIIGNIGLEKAMSRRTSETLVQFWEVLAFMANSAVFLLIGLSFNASSLLNSLGMVVVAILLMLVSRIIVVYGLLPLTNILQTPQSKVPRNWMHAAYWGGLRGAIPVALVLGLSHYEHLSAENITLLTVLVFGVTLFSIIVQGFTMEPLLKRLGLTKSSSSK